MAPEKVVIGDCTLFRGDCREILPEVGLVDVLITDPPYGCGKAKWDVSFPTEWYGLAAPLAKRVVIITGSIGLADTLPLVGTDFVDIIAARNMNGMTRGPLGFGNWLAAVVAKSKPKQGPNAFDFSVSGKMPDHPSPKPIAYMRKLVDRVTTPLEKILDPFLGSGTTGVVCAETGRSFIGIELEPRYFDLACHRIEDAYRQADLLAGVAA